MNDKVTYLFGSEKPSSPKRTKEKKHKELETLEPLEKALVESTHALIDALLKCTAKQLKAMHHEDAMIVLKELEASILRVERAARLANLRT